MENIERMGRQKAITQKERNRRKKKSDGYDRIEYCTARMNKW